MKCAAQAEAVQLKADVQMWVVKVHHMSCTARLYISLRCRIDRMAQMVMFVSCHVHAQIARTDTHRYAQIDCQNWSCQVLCLLCSDAADNVELSDVST